MTAQALADNDIIIIGGGMVGLLFANALAEHEFNILIIDQRPPLTNWDSSHIDLRTSAITRASQRMFEKLGVWQQIYKMRVGPFREMHVWDAGGSGSIHFDSADIGEPQLGHIVENTIMQFALTQRLLDFNNVRFHHDSKPQEFTVHEDFVQLIMDDEKQYSAQLMVGADGSQSWVRQSIHIPVRTTDYHQTAVVANVKTEKHHQYTAWQRFLPTGPLAFLPLFDGTSSIVWSTSHEQAEMLISLDDPAFCNTLGEHFAHQLGDILETSVRATFPLKAQHAQHYVRPRIALIGDAAHTIHPLAGQGVNLGFADAACLAQVILSARAKETSIGDYETLRRYERWRKGDNITMLNAMTGFKSLFGNTNPLISTLRNMGLNVTNNISPVKNTIIRLAMGLTGDLPDLAKP